MIFRKLFKRSSSVTVAIEADSKEKAQKIFDDWYEDSENNEDLNETLSERETDTEEWLAPFATAELHDKYCDDDFLISSPEYQHHIKEDENEQKYDLSFTFECTPEINKIWTNIDMETVLNHLIVANTQYYLKPIPPIHGLRTMTDNVQVLCYKLKRRNM